MKKILIVAMALIMPISAVYASCSGTVLDEYDEGMIGATVMIKGTTSGTVTDIDGKFALSSCKAGDTLQFSYFGYQTQEIKITNANKSGLAVKMIEDAEILDPCSNGYYGSSCMQCPMVAESFAASSSGDRDVITTCYAPAGTYTDGTGVYEFIDVCYYTE